MSDNMKDIEAIKKIIFENEDIDWKARYEQLVSGQYGAFEMWSSKGEIDGYRGFRKDFGTTDIYPTYREAIEAALEELTDDQ
jgi:hypothetical protein